MAVFSLSYPLQKKERSDWKQFAQNENENKQIENNITSCKKLKFSCLFKGIEACLR